jgi:hypothetical protein
MKVACFPGRYLLLAFISNALRKLRSADFNNVYYSSRDVCQAGQINPGTGISRYSEGTAECLARRITVIANVTGTDNLLVIATNFLTR